MVKMEVFCSICQEKLAMEIVQEAEGDSNIIWVQCPRCNEIKPLEGVPEKKGSAEIKDIKSAHEKEAPAGPRESAGPQIYSPEKEYFPGDTIYHSTWDDTGEVVERERSSGGRQYVVVTFKKQGRRKLLISAGG